MKVEDPPGELNGFLEGVWTLEWSALSGESGSRQMDWSSGIRRSISLNLPLEEDLLILLYPPLLTDSCLPRPRGAWIPWYESSGELNLKDGAAVSILMTLTERGCSMENFNCSRFLAEMAALEDPWLTDRELLVRQLARQEMRSWYIRERTLFETVLDLDAGIWYGPSLERAAEVAEGDEGSGTSHNLPEGWGFLFSPGRGEVLEYQVDEYGLAVLFREPLLQGVSSR